MTLVTADGEPMNLRDRLRTGTRRAQDALEEAFARFDLATPEGTAAFLAAQADIVATLRRDRDGPLSRPLEEAAETLAADLAALGRRDPPAPRLGPSMNDAVARTWLWHATRLPMRMQARRLGPDLPDRALRAPRDSGAWRDFCAVLEAREGYGAAAERALTSANEWYALYETVCHARARSA